MNCFHYSDEPCYCDEEPVTPCCHFCGKDMPRGAAGEIPGEGEACGDCWDEFKAEGLVSA